MISACPRSYTAFSSSTYQELPFVQVRPLTDDLAETGVKAGQPVPGSERERLADGWAHDRGAGSDAAGVMGVRVVHTIWAACTCAPRYRSWPVPFGGDPRG